MVGNEGVGKPFWLSQCLGPAAVPWASHWFSFLQRRKLIIGIVLEETWFVRGKDSARWPQTRPPTLRRETLMVVMDLGARTQCWAPCGKFHGGVHSKCSTEEDETVCAWGSKYTCSGSPSGKWSIHRTPRRRVVRRDWGGRLLQPMNCSCQDQINANKTQELL